MLDVEVEEVVEGGVDEAVVDAGATEVVLGRGWQKSFGLVY